MKGKKFFLKFSRWEARKMISFDNIFLTESRQGQRLNFVYSLLNQENL